jgi:hypothetical protein
MPDNHIGVEPLRTDPNDAGPLSDADRAARIEQLLLSGLDHYFGGNYEQAINVWTRVAFLSEGTVGHAPTSNAPAARWLNVSANPRRAFTRGSPPTIPEICSAPVIC